MLGKRGELIQIGKDVICTKLGYNLEYQELEIKGRLDTYRVSLPLLGNYQQDNVAAAIAALES